MEGDTTAGPQAARDTRVSAYLAARRRGDTAAARRIAAEEQKPVPRKDVAGA
jgi:hypothetical protein